MKIIVKLFPPSYHRLQNDKAEDTEDEYMHEDVDIVRYFLLPHRIF